MSHLNRWKWWNQDELITHNHNNNDNPLLSADNLNNNQHDNNKNRTASNSLMQVMYAISSSSHPYMYFLNGVVFCLQLLLLLLSFVQYCCVDADSVVHVCKKYTLKNVIGCYCCCSCWKSVACSLGSYVIGTVFSSTVFHSLQYNGTQL